MKPWGTQKIVGNMNLNIPSIEKLVDIIEAIEIPEERCLVGLCYLTGGRISEIIGSTRYKRDLSAIKREQFQIDTIDGHKILKITIRTLKKRGEHKDSFFRVIPIPLDIKVNKEILRLIWGYIKEFDKKDELFDFKYTKALRIIKKNTGWNPHWIRHIRTTHLLSVYKFKEEKVRIFMGWADLRPLSRYSELKWVDIVPEYYN